MTITVETKGNTKILHLHNGEATREDLLPIMSVIGKNIKDNYTKIIINMEEIKLIDSNGIGVLIAARALLLGINGQLILTRATKSVIGVMKIMKIYDKFVVTDTIDKALTL